MPTASEIAEELARKTQALHSDLKSNLDAAIAGVLERDRAKQIALPASRSRSSFLRHIVVLILSLSSVVALSQGMISPERLLVELSKHDKPNALVSMDEVRIIYCAIDISLALAVMFVAAASLRTMAQFGGNKRGVLKEVAKLRAEEEKHWEELKGMLESIRANTNKALDLVSAGRRQEEETDGSGAGTTSPTVK